MKWLEGITQSVISYISHPIFWMTVLILISFCQFFMSISFIIYDSVFSVSKTYFWLSQRVSQEFFGYSGLTVAMLNLILIRRGAMVFLFPLTVGYWLILAYGTYASVGGFTPGFAFTTSVMFFCCLSYISAGGFSILHYRGTHANYDTKNYERRAVKDRSG